MLAKYFNWLCFLLTIAGLIFFNFIADPYYLLMTTAQYPHQDFDSYDSFHEGFQLLNSTELVFNVPNESTVDFVGCCLERQVLVSYLFDQKERTDKYQLIEMNNVYFSNKCDVFHHQTLVQFCRVFPEPFVEYQFNARNVSYIDNVLNVYMPYPFHIGEFFILTLSELSLFPKEIIEKSKIVSYSDSAIVTEALRSFGMGMDQIVLTSDQEEIFHVQNLYTISPHHCNTQTPLAIERLRNHFVKYYDLDKAPPTKFVFLSRKGKTNELMNYEELLSVFHKNYPNIEWNVDDIPDTLPEIIRYYNNILCLFSSTSSYIALSLLMQKGTVVCDVQGQFFEPLFLHASAFLGHHHILARIPNMKVIKDEDYKLSIYTALGMLKTALKYINQTS